MRYQPRTRRPGVVLLVVMAMLAIFAALGISFVFYADNEATAAFYNSEALKQDQADIDPEVLMSYFLGQVIYDSDNAYSAMRGWSLARSMYGASPNGLNYVPFNGIGRSVLSPNSVNFGGTSADYFNLINYQRYEIPNWSNATTYNPGNAVISAGNIYLCIAPNINQIPPNPTYWSAQPADPLMNGPLGNTMLPNVERKPEFYGKTGDANFRYVGGANPPWTAYDTNNIFLAQIDTNGFVTLPSYFRLWTNPLDFPPLGPNFPAWPLGPDMSAKAKYMTLRPHASWHPGFNPTLTGSPFGLPDSDVGGDVKNLDSGPGSKIGLINFNNDSRWMDLGFPIMSAPNGKRYRPLFAPLIVDLNNRLHLWAHGNADNVSNQGYGPPEVNLAKLRTNITAAQLAELKSYLQWRATTTAAGVATGIRAGPWYAPVDPDGRDGATSTAPLTLATAGPPFSMFPTYAKGWDNDPANGNPTLGFDPNLKPLSAAHMEAILRHFGTNSPTLTSEPYRRMPTIFSSLRARNAVTTHSWGLDRIMAAPYIFDPATAPYTFNPAMTPYPTGVAPTTPNPAVPTPVPANSEFTADWRSKLGEHLRVNINRPLADYPAQNAAGVMDVSIAAVRNAFLAAQADRQVLAQEIFAALVRVTGAQDPNAGAAPAFQFNAARWLAQLAVNMVDYVDNDDYNTPFPWYTNTTAPTKNEVVFGTELPRLVLNEVYAQRDNDAKGAGKGKPNGKATGLLSQDLNLWVELHNPFTSTPAGNSYPRDGGIARLIINNNPVYQVVYCVSDPVLSLNLRDPSNNLGDLDVPLTPPLTNFAALASTASDWVAAPLTATSEQVLPAGGALSGPSGSNQGFYVFGPPANYTAATDPNLPTTHKSAWMSMKLDNGSVASNVTVLLRRLACPHVPPQTNPALPLYNPYITVDYVDGVPTADRRLDNGKGMPSNLLTSAYGRKQPHTADRSQFAAQTTTVAMQPNNTFYSHNTPRDNPFDWLVHLDRSVVNQLELLHVSAFKPHELTQQFISPGGKFQHYAPWPVQNALIYRALDLLVPVSPIAGSMRGGRWPGSVNLNTVMDPQVFSALCDANGVSFTQANVNAMFNDLKIARSAIDLANPPSLPPQEGYPFRSFASGKLVDTCFRPDPGTPSRPLFSVPGKAHPYEQAALLQKIHNNITTTSSVFAIWWTVGYFEVVDETVRPARLGKEIGRDENRHIRHRFFAIVDRSGLQLFAGKSSTTVAAGPTAQTMTCNAASVSTMAGLTTTWNNTQPYVASNTVVDGGVAYFCIQANKATATSNTAYWQPVLQKGMLLEVDTGANAEVVAVTAVAGNTITAIFTKSHAANVPIVCRGNPGPRTPPPGAAIPAGWMPYNPRQDANVVLHMSVIR